MAYPGARGAGRLPEGTTVSWLTRLLVDGAHGYDSVYRRIYRALRACENCGHVRRTGSLERRVAGCWEYVSDGAWFGRGPISWQVTSAGADYLAAWAEAAGACGFPVITGGKRESGIAGAGHQSASLTREEGQEVMTTMTMTDELEPAGAEAMRLAALAIADGLTDHDLSIRIPEWEGTQLLKVINARGLLCEVLIGADGSVEWECQPLGHHQANPAWTAQTVLRILGGDAGERPVTEPSRQLSFESVVGQILASRGMNVSRNAYQKPGDTYSEIDATNPGQPGRGRVRVGDDGLILWQCQIRQDDPEDNQALEPGEIAGILGQALAERLC